MRPGWRRGYGVSGTLSALWLYPIKGCGGTALDRAQVAAHGLAFDRRWMLVDELGVFVSQRSDPQMALIRVRVHHGRLQVDAPEMPTLEVDLEPSSGDQVEVRIWSDVCVARAAGEPEDHWFSRFLGRAVRLVYVPDASLRTVDRDYSQPGDVVGFADGFPFLLTSVTSLGDLNARAGTSLPMDRFRPNLVVDGFDAFAEDGWKQIRVGDVSFRVAKPCARCSVTTVDQATAEVGKEPLKTLSTYRRVRGKVMFGQNLIQDGGGIVQVGDPVEVIA